MKSRTVIALIVVAAVVVVAGAGVVGWWMLRHGSVRSVAEQYLHALEAGDIDTIDTMMAGLPLNREQRTTIGQAFAGATGHLTSARIDDIGSDGGVRATGRLDGSPVTIFFAVSRSGKLTGDFLGSLTVYPSIGTAARVGDATILAGATVGLLPAVYPVRALPDEVLHGTRTVALSNESSTTVDLPVALADGATDAVQKQLAAYEDRCAASTTTVPAHCGLRVPWAADLRTLTSLDFRIDRRPALALAPDGSSFAASNGKITATARGKGWDGASHTLVYRADDWALRGRVVFDGATVSLHVD